MKMKGIVMLLVCLLAVNVFVLADPTPARLLTEQAESRADVLGAAQGKTNTAAAGNATELLANVTQITKTWQGYYGNITGKIVLDNSNNKSMYDWDVTAPTGTVLAVNASISDWSNIECFNFTNGGGELNLTAYETNLNCTGDDDGVNETFDGTTHETITVGTSSFTNECPAVLTYVNDGASSDFDEIMLYEPGANLVVFASKIHDDTSGFDNTPTDFQMLVGEDGHGSAASTYTTYYFYIEIT